MYRRYKSTRVYSETRDENGKWSRSSKVSEATWWRKYTECPQWHWCVLPSFPSRARTSLQVMGVRMSKFSATTRTWLHTLSLMLQIGALTNCLTMGGKSATTEQSAPVKPTTDSLLWNHKYSLYWHTHTHPFNGLLSETTQVSRYWILVKQETVSGSGISWAICKSASRSRQITTSVPHH